MTKPTVTQTVSLGKCDDFLFLIFLIAYFKREPDERIDMSQAPPLTLRQYIDINHKFVDAPLNGMTLLHHAVIVNKLPIVFLIVRCTGVDLNALDNDGQSALHKCVLHGSCKFELDLFYFIFN